MNSQIGHTIDVDPLVGTLLDGRYLVNYLVARGGMGNIYQAHDVRQGRVVALKLLRSEYNGDQSIVDRFLREAHALERLTHPNICHIFGYGCTPDGNHYFAMEFLEGKALDAVLREKRVLPPAQAIRYVARAAAALCDAHNKGVIHRDLKPANIFIVQAGNTDDVKVLDFGVAKLQDGDPMFMGRLTNAGATLGTPFYMSPEQIQASDVDARTDVYALGIILWECLFGAPPFIGNNLIDVFSAAVNQKLPKLPKNIRSNKQWRKIYAVLQKALQKDRDKRYPSMIAFLHALEDLGRELGVDLSDERSGIHALTTTHQNLSAGGFGRFIDVVHDWVHGVSPLRLVVIGAIVCLCVGAIATAIVVGSTPKAVAPQVRVDTYKFFANYPADVQIDGKKVGTTPMSIDLRDDEPPFTVVLRYGDEYADSFTVENRIDGIAGYAANLVSDDDDGIDDESPTLKIETTPEGASVVGKDVGVYCTTPCTIDIADKSRFILDISLEGYRCEHIVVVPRGKSFVLKTNLFR